LHYTDADRAPSTNPHAAGAAFIGERLAILSMVPTMKDFYQMFIHMVQLGGESGQSLIVLRDVDATLFLPIYIGQFEATSILMELEGIHPARPLTHDLIRNIFHSLNVSVARVIVTDLIDRTFYAVIHAIKDTRPVEIDSRPSDAIAIAVRLGVPIFATREVLEKAALSADSTDEKELEEFRRFLDNINPEDFKE